MENQNILRIVLGLAIIAAFFLPLNSTPVFGESLSSVNVLSDTFQHIGRLGELPLAQVVTAICLIIVLLCAVVEVATGVIKRDASVYFNLIPLASIIAMTAFNAAQSADTVAQTLQSLGSGFYIMLFASFLLPFTSFTINNNSAASA